MPFNTLFIYSWLWSFTSDVRRFILLNISCLFISKRCPHPVLLRVHLVMCSLFQAEYDAMLQEFAGEGIPLVASSVPADSFAPFLNDLLPLIMSKAVSLWLLTKAGV